MKKIIGILLCCLPLTVSAAGTSVPLEKAQINPRDNASLQRGAKTYMNYCAGCHSLRYMRFSGMAKDIGITDMQGNVLDDLLLDNLIFTGATTQETLQVSMSEPQAATWFGVAPPDLSLITRVRGVNWLYTYLTSFYQDPSRPWGTNNLVFKDVAMPNVFAQLQGVQEPVYKTITKKIGTEERQVKVIDHLKLVQQGELNKAQFDRTVNDLVNFLDYVAEPAKADRENLGIWVLLFLVVLLVFMYFLKKEYWRDVK